MKKIDIMFWARIILTFTTIFFGTIFCTVVFLPNKNIKMWIIDFCFFIAFAILIMPRGVLTKEEYYDNRY